MKIIKVSVIKIPSDGWIFRIKTDGFPEYHDSINHFPTRQKAMVAGKLLASKILKEIAQ